jgi:site-specific DNA-cytosine methylase
MEKNQNGMGVAKEGDPAYTIDTTGAQAVCQPVAIQGTIIGRNENAGPQGVGATEGGPMFTLTKTDIHAVAIPFRKSKRDCSTTDNETWVEADASNTLNNFDPGDTRTTHAVLHCSDVAPTVTSSGPPYSRTGNERVEAEALAITTQTANCEISGTLRANPGSGWRSDGTPVEPVVMTAIAVRRLTPNECYRLQGFPDNWGRIPWKGKPAEECPDGPQYKAAGNSMAVPCMFWIGNRIAEYEAKA